MDVTLLRTTVSPETAIQDWNAYLRDLEDMELAPKVRLWLNLIASKKELD